jgi:hypothetical protein
VIVLFSFVSFLLLLFVFDYTELCFLLASAFRLALPCLGLALLRRNDPFER